MLYEANLRPKVYEFVKIRAIAMVSSSTSMRISAFFAASFVSYGIHLPFFPVLLASRGQDEAAVAIILALPIVLRVTTASALGAAADRFGDRRRALVVYSGLVVLGFAALGPAGSFWSLAAATAATAFAWNGILPVTDAMATSAVRRGLGVYGRMRVWGSAAFVAGNLAGGVVAARFGAEAIWWFVMASFALQFAVAFLLPDDRALRETAAGAREATRVALAGLLGDRRLMATLVGSAVLQASHAMLYGFSSLYWASLGFSGDAIGLLWATGVIGEIALFTFSGRVLGRLTPRRLLMLGAAAAVVRWTVFPLLPAALPAWMAVQLLHAATFAAAHLGIMHIVTHRVAERRAATAQGLMVSINGGAMALSTLASGLLYRAWGGGGFAGMAVVAALGGVILAIATAPQPHSAGGGGKTSEPS